MKPKKLFVLFGCVLLGIVGYALLRPKSEPTLFDEGFGLKLVNEERMWMGRSFVLKPSYASTQDVATLDRRIRRELVSSGVAFGHGLTYVTTTE